MQTRRAKTLWNAAGVAMSDSRLSRKLRTPADTAMWNRAAAT
jgi:hypothetical protein